MMTDKYNKIFLTGYCGTGKSTVGRNLAQRLEWDFRDMDDEIVAQAGQSIDELTKGGTSWQKFRELELEVLRDLLQQKDIVISMGGGACVNNVVRENDDRTYGEIGKVILDSAPRALVVLLTADEEVLARRIGRAEMRQTETRRPILDEKTAKQVKATTKEHKGDPARQKEILADEIVKNSLRVYRERKDLYAALTDKVVNTEGRVADSVKKIMGFLE
ncbi:MAG: AAA family ATPase [Parcubacteria group bacterium]|nr:AAA family ATPase [Parcubacteria group bacterium]